jgi:hypothetical protein
MANIRVLAGCANRDDVGKELMIPRRVGLIRRDSAYRKINAEVPESPPFLQSSNRSQTGWHPHSIAASSAPSSGLAK